MFSREGKIKHCKTWVKIRKLPFDYGKSPLPDH